MPVDSQESGEKEALLGRQSAAPDRFYYESLKDSLPETACDDETESENESVHLHVPTAKYWYRWYICGIFSMCGLLQGAIWNTWSPIDKSAECALGFTPGDITLLTNWGPILFLVTMPIVMWMLDKFGLRLPNVLSAFFMALGTGLRCLPVPVHVLKYFIHAGQILNGITGCSIMASPPLLSNVWFPPEERVTATSVSTLFNYFGTGFAYIIGPLMVQQPWNDTSSNGSATGNVSGNSTCNTVEEEHTIRNEIENLMYLEFALSVVVFLCMLFYFPNHPPKPPSASASIGRMDFWAGLKALRYQPAFLVITLTFAMSLGGYGGWTGVFSVLLNELSVLQDEAGKLGFIMTLVGCFVGMLVGWFADKFKGHIKVMFISLFVIAFFAYLYYTNMVDGWLEVKGFEFSHVGLWIDCIIIGIVMNAAVPLGMEMGADAAYPTSEAISASVIVWSFNLLSFVFLLVLQVSNAHITNYLMLGFIGLSIPLLIFFTKEPSSRMHIDMTNSVDTTVPDVPVQKNLDRNVNIGGEDIFPQRSLDSDAVA